MGSIGYIAGSLGYLPPCHYEEAASHYPLWKPHGNYWPRGEAPPPYEEAVAAARVEAVLAARNSAGKFRTVSACFFNVHLTANRRW